MLIEILKFITYSAFIVIISKYVLVSTLRKLAEALNLKPKTVGDIAGYATSMPELLTIGTSSFNGLISASIVNVFSSNIINALQYLASILLNRNLKTLKNKAIIIDLVLVVITIIIPIVLILLDIEMNIMFVPIFVLLYIFFSFLNSNAHKLHLRKEDMILENQIQKEGKFRKNNKKKLTKYIVYLLITGVLLFVIGDLLGENLENLCNRFHVSQSIIGFLLGSITSIPELITFFESQKHYKKQESDAILGVVEATNNLLTSNILNLFIIQSIGILLYKIVI